MFPKTNDNGKHLFSVQNGKTLKIVVGSKAILYDKPPRNDV